MSDNMTINDLVRQVWLLSPEDQALFLDKLGIQAQKRADEMIYDPEIERDGPNSDLLQDYTKDLRFKGGRVCPHCGCVEVSKRGSRTNARGERVQRYYCHGCETSFVANANSVTACTHKGFKTWQRFLQCMADGESLPKTARLCGIHTNTAFRWRHKVLDCLQTMQNGVLLNGIIEADETFIRESYKGNHKKDTRFVSYRKSRKRGTDKDEIRWENPETGEVEFAEPKDVRGLSAEQICIPCAVDRERESVAKVGKQGVVSKVCLNKTLGDNVKNDSVLCTDQCRSYGSFSKQHSMDLYQLKNGKGSIKGIFHIQHINSYHNELKRFLDNFRGVSTKYMDNYLVWYNLLRYSNHTNTEKVKVFLEYVLNEQFLERVSAISDRKQYPLRAKLGKREWSVETMRDDNGNLHPLFPDLIDVYNSENKVYVWRPQGA